MIDPKNRRRAKRLQAKGLNWMVHALMLSGVHRADGRTLGLNIQWDPGDQNYLVVAISSGGEDLEGFFDEHSHETLGLFETEVEAKMVCTAYAIKWLKSEAVEEQCECGPISEVG